MSRQLVVQAQETDKMYLKIEVASGNDADAENSKGIEFDLCSTLSGLGFIIVVDYKGQHVTEFMNFRDVVTQWVDGIVADIDEGASK